MGFLHEQNEFPPVNVTIIPDKYTYLYGIYIIMSYLVIYLQDSEGFGPQGFLGFSSAHHNTTVPWRIDHNSNNTLFTEFEKSEWKWHSK